MIKFIKTLCVISLFFVSCKKQNSDSEIIVDNGVNDFVWKAMNSWYNWQSSTTDLSDNKDDNFSSYNSYLNSFDDPEDLFNSLIFEPGDTDRFSWFIEDYEVQQQSFQGISTSFGINILLTSINDTDNVIMLFEHISENSPADIAGFKRGDIVNGINGTIMTSSNYSSVLSAYYNDESVEFNFVESDGITSLKNETITKSVVSSNPVYLTKTFDNINGQKVGYLVYNSFINSYNDELNDAFATLASENINELILDLRLNGGGSVETSAYLASMIYDGANTDDIFAKLTFNSKKSNYDGTYTFENNLEKYDSSNNELGSESINRISGLNRVYVLTSGSTASASEMIINGLKAYMDVIIVGDTTYGKNVGSITLYDAPDNDYFGIDNADPSHKYAMQPIVFQIFNANDESDYTQGFEPDIVVEEWKYWNTILEFGNEEEVVLKAALDNIKGISAKSINTSNSSKKINIQSSNNKFETEMYIDKNYFK